MTRRELYRMKKRIKAHLKRAGVILALILAVVLMICGCLYIFEHLFQKEKAVERTDSGTISNEQTNEDVPPEEGTQEPEESLPYEYTYIQPDASGLSIVLDAGHGGIDGGTQSGDVLEKDINLSITSKVAALLKEAGATVTMIRETDEYVDLADRTYKSNQTGGNLFLSLHCNSFEDDTSINGLEIYYHKNSETSKQYAETTTQYLKDTQTIHVRDASQQNMQVLRNSSFPAIMIEMGFLSNPEECANLNNPLYQDFLAQMITASIVETLKPTSAQ